MWWNQSSGEDSSGYPSDWNQRRSKVLRRDKWTCQSCGRTGGPRGTAELHAHHILPKSKGGGHSLDNLTTLCDRCHAEYHDDPRLLSGAETDTNGNAFSGHLKVGLLTGWWTLGAGNLIYEVMRRNRTSSESNIKKKREQGLEDLQELEKERKQLPESTEVSWLQGHKKVFFDSGWWSFGLANLIYEIFRESGTPETDDEGRPRLGKREGENGFWQTRVDKGRNREYNGCPSCDEMALTVSWLKLDDGSKTKAVECQSCSATFDETSNGLEEVNNPNELDSGGSAVMQELFG